MNESPAYLIHKLALDLDRVADRLLQQQLHISYARFSFLFALSDLKQTTQHTLAVRLGYSDPAVSNMLSELTKSGLVRVTIDPTHQRRRLVANTREGEAIVQTAVTILDNCFSDIAIKAEVDEQAYSLLTRRLAEAVAQKQLT